MRDSNPRGHKDHRLSRPAPYQARRTPQRYLYFIFTCHSIVEINLFTNMILPYFCLLCVGAAL